MAREINEDELHMVVTLIVKLMREYRRMKLFASVYDYTLTQTTISDASRRAATAIKDFDTTFPA